MATIIKPSESSGGGSFEPHPPGSFLAVLADVFIKSFPNKYKGQMLKFGKNKGKPDERETIDKVCLAFLTEEPIEVDGQLKPRYASYWASAGFGTSDYPSNLRKFLKGWWPTLTDAVIDADPANGFDLDRFIGRGAYITIQNEPDRHDPSKIWSNVTGAMQPPKGSTIPLIPADFVRHDAKQQAAPAAALVAQPVQQPSQRMAPPDLKLQQQQARHAPPLTDEENAMAELDKHEYTKDEVDPW